MNEYKPEIEDGRERQWRQKIIYVFFWKVQIVLSLFLIQIASNLFSHQLLQEIVLNIAKLNVV